MKLLLAARNLIAVDILHHSGLDPFDHSEFLVLGELNPELLQVSIVLVV